MISLIIKILRIIPAIAKAIAGKTNGKKTVIGIITIAAGLVMLFIPVLSHMAVETIITGLVIMLGGAAHKIVKAQKAEKSAK